MPLFRSIREGDRGRNISSRKPKKVPFLGLQPLLHFSLKRWLYGLAPYSQVRGKHFRSPPEIFLPFVLISQPSAQTPLFSGVPPSSDRAPAASPCHKEGGVSFVWPTSHLFSLYHAVTTDSDGNLRRASFSFFPASSPLGGGGVEKKRTFLPLA